MKKILIIDYDQNSLATLQGVFSGQGYQVVTAADGQTGWDRYNKESPDLVLMEAMLPKVHGFELCQRITSERNSQATVFIMTGVYKDRVYRTEALRTYGASEYFEKPLKMAELLASVQAVLGRPEPKPAAAPGPAPAAAAASAPASAGRPEPAPAEPRRREKPKDDDSLFALPEDLDRLSRETPKARKPVPASVPARREPGAETRLDAATDELLKSVLLEHMAAAKAVVAKPAGGNGNGNGNGHGATDIDKFLKSALADLDLTKEKVKVPKTAPLPPPPPPVKAKPAPAPAPVPEPKPKPTPPPAPAPVLEAKPRPTPPPAPAPKAGVAPAPAADMKNTLTPGDPGSDISPFFRPEKRMPEPPAGRPRPVFTEKKPAPAPQPVRDEPRKREAEAIAAADLFQDVAPGKDKKGSPKIVWIGLGVVALAALGFVLLRPKRPAPAPVPEATQTASSVTDPSSAPAQPVQEAPAPEIKPAPAKAKTQPQAQPKTKPVDTAPAADAILPAPAAGLPPLTAALDRGTTGGQNGPGSNPAPTGTAPVNAAEPEKPAADPASNAGPGAAGAPSPAAAPAAAPATPVREGDLVELGAVNELPKLLKSVNPIYPSAAQRIGLGGAITVNALIDEKGNVIDTGILKGIQDDNGLGKAAEAAVKKWKFQPATKNGVAVKVWKSFVIVFKPEAAPARANA